MCACVSWQQTTVLRVVLLLRQTISNKKSRWLLTVSRILCLISDNCKDYDISLDLEYRAMWTLTHFVI